MFLTVLTRVYKRPKMLRRNIESLLIQTCQDYEQVFLVDEVGRGVEWANGQFARNLDKINGEYVLILDDDDELFVEDAVETLKNAVKDRPELVIFKAVHERLGILPSSDIWGKLPAPGRIGSCDFITRSDVFRRHAKAFDKPREGDYALLSSIWREEPDVIWLDRILANVQRISKGDPE